ncbi:hypothetical protein FKW77_008779 [Venturia effusa]|uniref:SH3 domain-containing protein n=1 Tax=Venturia effusa TaxID=50376 RepID=A0A517L021_9PEZI|nr:hypothetical protein FKW77_008779 [Venturia effusa]
MAAELSEAAYATPLKALVTEPHKPRDILELEVKRGAKLLLLEPKGEWWYVARHIKSGKEGWVPAKHIRILPQLDSYTMSKLFLEWYDKKEVAFGDGSKARLLGEGVEGVKRERVNRDTFPLPPPEVDVCDKVVCKMRKLEKGLGVCAHDMEAFLKAGVGELYGAKFLWKESLQWHPDNVGRKCRNDFVDEARKLVSEMYVIFQELIAQAREKDGEE